jgi:hypothetical protein
VLLDALVGRRIHARIDGQDTTQTEPIDIKPEWPCFGERLRGGFCIAPAAETPACSPGEDSACADACGRIEQALIDDAKRPPDAKLREVSCATPSSCGFVVELGGACYANDRNGFVVEPPVPCP